MHKPGGAVDRVRVVGPLVPFVARLRSALRDAGYTPSSTVNQVRLLAHLSRWLDAGRLGVADLTDERVEEFLASRRARGCTWSVSRRALTPLLGLLAELGGRPTVEHPAPASPTEAVVARFALPSHGSTVDSQVRRVSVGASIKRGISGGWVLAEQCRAGDLVNALHDARASEVAIRGAQDVERLLGRPIEDDARLAS